MRCHFCGAGRPEGAGACPACGESVAPDPTAGRWWQSNATVIVALAVAGPFALPLVWTHPRYKVATKVALTVMTVAFTVWATLFAKDLLNRLVTVLSTGPGA